MGWQVVVYVAMYWVTGYVLRWCCGLYMFHSVVVMVLVHVWPALVQVVVHGYRERLAIRNNLCWGLGNMTCGCDRWGHVLCCMLNCLFRVVGVWLCVWWVLRRDRWFLFGLIGISFLLHVDWDRQEHHVVVTVIRGCVVVCIGGYGYSVRLQCTVTVYGYSAVSYTHLTLPTKA